MHMHPSLDTFVIALLLDVPATRALCGQRSGDALYYPPHVTLKGRFSIAREHGVSAIIDSIATSAHMFPWFEAKFAGPVRISPSLWWMECTTDCLGFQAFIGLHRHLLDNLSRNRLLDRDDTAKAFQGNCFRPHISLAWSASGAPVAFAPKEIDDLTVQFDRWALFKCSEPMKSGAAEMVATGQLGFRGMTDTAVPVTQIAAM